MGKVKDVCNPYSNRIWFFFDLAVCERKVIIFLTISKHDITSQVWKSE